MRLWPRRRVYVDDLPETHDGRFLVAFLLVLVGALGGVYALGYLVAGDKVPTGTTVAGVEIGGMSRAAARGLLEREVDAELRQPLTARAGTFTQKLVPALSGVSFDVDATLDEAMGGADWDPHHMLAVVQGGGRVDPVLSVDADSLRSVLTPLAADVSVAPVGASVSVQSTRAVVHPGRPGRRLDVGAASQRIISALQQQAAAAQIRLASVAPPVDTAAAHAFVDNTVGPALSGPVVIAVAGAEVTVTPAQFGPALRVAQMPGALRLGIGADDLFARTVSLLTSAPGRPVNARIAFHGSTPVVVPSRAGTVVDKEVWAKAVLLAATSGDGRRAVAHVHPAVPAFTTRDAEALHIEVPIATATKPARAADGGPLVVQTNRLNGTVVLPGADFSYRRSTGQRGSSTLSPTLTAATQSAAEHGGMAITRRLATPPYGRDLSFRNTSDFPVYVRSWLVRRAGAPPTVHVQLWSSRAAP